MATHRDAPSSLVDLGTFVHPAVCGSRADPPPSWHGGRVRSLHSSAGGPEGAGIDDQGQVAAWSMYNWADHGWAAPVAGVLIGPWMLSLATGAVGARGTLIAVGPLQLRADAFPSAMIAVAAVLQLVVLPGVGAVVDSRGNKRRWLAGACGGGSVICALLALTSGHQWLLAGALFLAGSVVEGMSDLVWNGMLPELASPARTEAVSSRGTAVGYLGAGMILALDLVLIQIHGTLGLSKSAAVRICFLTAAGWWAGFGLRSLRRLNPRPRLSASRKPDGGTWSRLRADLAWLRTMPQTRRFVMAYLCFADAMSAVIALASTFLTHELFADNSTRASPFLFELILLIQFVAMGGALLSSAMARRIGSRRAVLVNLVIWCAVIVFAYAALHTEADAVAMGVVIGLVLGGTTALARSLFARMVPAGREVTFFSLYEVCSKGTAWIAPLLFTIVVDITGSFRQAILSLIVLFVLGLVLLFRTDTDAAAREAESRPLSV
ncbi:MAG: MFS transporter [Actinomycetota bacterium]|nr:MFS transporter [Actinomycetota bacterium]